MRKFILKAVFWLVVLCVLAFTGGCAGVAFGLFYVPWWVLASLGYGAMFLLVVLFIVTSLKYEQ